MEITPHRIVGKRYKREKRNVKSAAVSVDAAKEDMVEDTCLILAAVVMVVTEEVENETLN